LPRSAARRAISRDDLPVDPAEMATCLIGCRIVSDAPEGRTVARITETEAYLWNDAAAHSFRGRTLRNASLFLERGHAYVYFIYGNHYCFNVSGDRAGVGAGVLVRAAEPLDGFELIRARRGMVRDLDLLRGPGRLAQGLGISREHDGLDLTTGKRLWIAPRVRPVPNVGVTVRIGITKECELPLRFYDADSAHVSGPKRLR